VQYTSILILRYFSEGLTKYKAISGVILSQLERPCNDVDNLHSFISFYFGQKFSDGVKDTKNEIHYCTRSVYKNSKNQAFVEA